jgi:hypothetical protein
MNREELFAKATAPCLHCMKTEEINEASIDLDKITLRFGEMEPVVIPRNAIRTRLRLIDWIYRLTGWLGMNLQRLRTFVEAIYRHHGWPLLGSEDDPFLVPGPTSGSETETRMAAVSAA